MPATTTTLAFFSSSAASFRPAPYTPAATPAASSSSSAPSKPTFSTRSSSRGDTHNHDSLAIPLSMDPLLTDPNVLFIHPPFDAFPNAHIHPDGLTYSLMSENMGWFLDPKDFISQNNTNANAIAYPPHLEPPRGWCPAKKKDLKDRGGETWPEGEEPRLRCTFCRRTYAGVNAKSMWRRHVFEKHKIAMSNRRDGHTDRPRGRGSGKENKRLVSLKHSDSHDGLISIIVAPQTAPDTTAHKSRFRPAKAVDGYKKANKKVDRQASLPLTPRRTKRSLSVQSYDDDDDSDYEAPLKPTTPPLTPLPETSSDPPNIFGSDIAATSPTIMQPIVPESPYNPLQTPSFRHSPPQLPRPWRFSSPSHPFHSTEHDISLTMLAPPGETPNVKGATQLGVSSPATLAIQSSPLSTALHSESSNYETPARSNFLFGKPSSRSRLWDVSSPLSSGRSRRTRIASSPLPFSIRRAPKTHSRQPSDLSDAWFSEGSLASSTSSLPLESSPGDPFNIWPSINGGSTAMSPARLPQPPVESESPVVRSGSMSSLIGGIGLLEPFGYRNEVVPPTEDIDDDLKGILQLSSPSVRVDSRPDGKRSTPPIANSADFSPPSKKRRMSTGT